MKRELLIYGLILAAAALVAKWWWQGRYKAPPADRAAAGAPAQAGATAGGPAVPVAGSPSLSSNGKTETSPGVASQPSQTPAAAAGSPATPGIPGTSYPPSRQPAQTLNPAREEAEIIALNLRSFGQRFGGNPVGTNAEIVKILNGDNPQGARYLPQEHLRLNENGELLDAFGTPYFFHQISSLETEIRSAGPDKTLWTADDIAVK